MKAGGCLRFRPSLQQGEAGPFLIPVQGLVRPGQGVAPAWVSLAFVNQSPDDNKGIFKREDPYQAINRRIH